MDSKNVFAESLYNEWEKEGLFKAKPDSKKEKYSLLMPPPNLTGELHLGHAMQHSILDAIARYKRLKGFDVLLLPGVDHAGIQFEGTFNKKLSKEGLTLQKIGREEWFKRAFVFKEEMYNSARTTWKSMGVSADWQREVFTLDEKVKSAVFAEFKKFWDDELLYKGAYMVQWCPKCGTAIEDVEMEYEERKEKLYYVRYKIEGSRETIVVATARPETIAADVAIAVFAKHPKYSKFVGKKAINPFTNSLMPIVEDKRVDKDFGTGALKITPGHDMLDYKIGKDNNLPILHVVGKNGRITDLDPDLEGLKISESRQKATEKLEKLNLIEKTEDYVHAVPVCERCKTVVEPLISEEWFVKMDSLARKAVNNIDKINFAPRSFKKIIVDWFENIHDWSISRSLVWGHRIPVWYCKVCNPNHLVGKDKDMIVSLSEPKIVCKACGKKEWEQDGQVLDTWFSSGIWPLATLGWPEETDELKRYFPWDFEISAPEIKYLWISRMIMLSLYLRDEIPFKNMFFHGMIRDLQGRKFSKSLGNGIDPKTLIEAWGVDAVRMALYTYSVPGRDSKASKQTIEQRCKNFRNFSTKLRNITHFVIDLKPEGASKEFNLQDKDDKEIITKLSKTIQNVELMIERFDFHLAVDEIYNFVWHDFADIYIEKTKKRRKEAQLVLEKVLLDITIVLHPFMPFVTEELYRSFPENQKFIIKELWPAVKMKK
ncbi:MAG: valine--tRNA ligase [Candidatus Levybacteria bacterium CG10_big_fil_rev_8_21_14_0_10_36_7]|nr:MAG: valine--tRNA ligase [Candidatus Levybacteria bacterium CG10_big_fil_rev_8_21_14_0_10_36_7]